jgi:hypothetical protein
MAWFESHLGGSGSSEHTYSTEEQVIGTWIDGKTIYEKTIDLGETVSISNTNWTQTGVDISYVDTLIEAISPTYGTLMAGRNVNGILQCLTGRNGEDIYVQYITIQYTKSSS